MNEYTNHAQDWAQTQRQAGSESLAMTREYTLSELEFMPTIEQGHTDNLKIKTENIRVWLSRMNIEDGQPYNNQVTIERRNSDSQWVTYKQYEAK